MKPGRRALGVAESYRGRADGATTSTLAGVVVRADRAVDDLVVGECTVGGTDATDAIVEAWRRLDREDVAYCFVSGVALAWYNLVDVDRLAEALERPVLAVTYEESTGLSDAIEAAFDQPGREARLETYDALPARRRVTGVGPDPLFVRSAGIDDDDADRVLEAFTNERRPEPLRVAKLAARGVDAFRRA